MHIFQNSPLLTISHEWAVKKQKQKQKENNLSIFMVIESCGAFDLPSREYIDSKIMYSTEMSVKPKGNISPAIIDVLFH